MLFDFSAFAEESRLLCPVVTGLVLEVQQGHDSRDNLPVGREMLSLQRVRKYRRRKAVIRILQQQWSAAGKDKDGPYGRASRLVSARSTSATSNRVSH